MSIHALHDDHGRTVRYLRLSLTDRCNLRCLYCHSNARHQCIPHEKVLRYEEMIRLVQIVRGMGVGKVRLTGGEPFARKGCDDFLLRLRQRFDDLDIRITTNGTLLEEHIPLLQRIRISAVNLSLDSFDRETFARVTGRDMLPEVLRALDATLSDSGCEIQFHIYTTYDMAVTEKLRQERTVDYLIVLETGALEQIAGMYAQESEDRPGIYGIGNSIRCVYYLDEALVEGLVAADGYDMGYQSVLEISGALGNQLYAMKNRETDYRLLHKEDIFREEVQQFLHTYD